MQNVQDWHSSQVSEKHGAADSEKSFLFPIRRNFKFIFATVAEIRQVCTDSGVWKTCCRSFRGVLFTSVTPACRAIRILAPPSATPRKNYQNTRNSVRSYLRRRADWLALFFSLVESDLSGVTKGKYTIHTLNQKHHPATTLHTPHLPQIALPQDTRETDGVDKRGRHLNHRYLH